MTTASIHRHHDGQRCRRYQFRFVLVQRSVTAAAGIVSGPELNQKTAITTDDFP
jgi:hypothetical protein